MDSASRTSLCLSAPSRLSASQPWRHGWRAFLGSLVSLLLGSAGCGAAETAKQPTTVEELAVKLTETRSEIERLKSDWQWQRVLMESTQLALKDRVKRAQQERDLIEAETSHDREAIAAASARNDEARAALEALDRDSGKLRDELIALRPLLPPRLSRALELPYRSMNDAELGPGERMQFVMTILNRCIQFNSAITYSEETHETGGEGARLLEILYWGLSHGYAWDAAGNTAFVGRPGMEGWEWTADPAIAQDVEHMIAMHRDRADPAFIRVPAAIVKTPGSRAGD